MKRVKINGHSVVFYQDIETLPIVQFHRYSKYLLVDSGIGDTIADIDRHITKIVSFLATDAKKAHQELLNLRQNLYVVSQEQDFRYKSTLCLIKEVDGKRWKDFSDDGLETLYNMLNGERCDMVGRLSKELSETIDEHLHLYFPKVFDDSVEKNYCDLLRRRALLQAESIKTRKDNSEEIEKLTKQIIQMQTPKNFEGEESEEIKFDKQFEEMCLAISKEFNNNAKEFTTMEFYAAFERMDKQYRELSKEAKTNRR